MTKDRPDYVYGVNETRDFEIRCKVKEGKGWLHVTTVGVVVEIDKRGLLFMRRHDQIARMESVSKNKIKIYWPENTTVFDAEIKVEGDAVEFVEKVNAKYNFAANYPELHGVNTVRIDDKERERIIKVRTARAEHRIEIFTDEAKQWTDQLSDIKDDDENADAKRKEHIFHITRCNTIIEDCKQHIINLPKMVINRSKIAPAEIPNEDVYNDCWIERFGDCYCWVTANKRVPSERPDSKDITIQAFFKKHGEDTNLRALIPWSVYMRHGYPMLDTTYSYEPDLDKIPKGRVNTHLIDPKNSGDGSGYVFKVMMPTMTDEMLTEDMIAESYGMSKDEKGAWVHHDEKTASIVYYASDSSLLLGKEDDGVIRRKRITMKEMILLDKVNLVNERTKREVAAVSSDSA